MDMGKNLFKIAGLIAIITIFSKIVGFGRDVVTAQAYGASLVSDAYFYAYQIPALSLILLGGLGGPFHTATIAIFSKMINIEEKPPAEAQKLLNSYITMTGLFFLVLTLLLFFFSEPVIRVIASGASEDLIKLASAQLKIMSPMLFIGGIVGILYGISNIYNEFLYTSLSPTVASVAVIAAIMMFHNDTNGIILAWGTLIGAVGQLLLQLPVFFKSGFRYKPDFGFLNSNIGKLGMILLPAMISTTIGQINIYIDMFFTSKLEPGSWSAIGYANRIFQFPVGIIITAMLVPLFPMFASFVGKRDWGSLREYFHKGLSSLWFLSFPILAFIIIFAQDAIKLLFQRGQFTAHDTGMVSLALIYLTLSIVPYVARDTLTRIFYSFEDSLTPFLVALFSIIVKTGMNFMFINHLGIGAITLSTTAVTLVNCVLLAIFIRKKADLKYSAMVIPTMKIVAVTLIMSAIALILKMNLDALIPDNFISLAIKLVVYSIVCGVSYFGFAMLFKIDTAQQVLAKIKSRFVRSESQNIAINEE